VSHVPGKLETFSLDQCEGHTQILI
jgi:hypothetical protein